MTLREAFIREWRRLIRAGRSLDRQTVVVLVATAALVIIQNEAGSRRLFRTELSGFFPIEWRGILAWGWWFGIQGLTGFVLPAAILFFYFRRSPREMGLGLGDWRFAGLLAGLYLPVVMVGTWFLSADPAFQSHYPHHQPAAFDWGLFLIYETLFLLYWVGWEYLWRGFVLFGTAHTFGLYAIFVQAVPFAILHLAKPLPEAVLSIVGGVALGALVWRCRSFWIAVPIHAAQMMILDLWCTLRMRSGNNGLGPDALIDVLFG